jgi:DNA-binding NtrC family response regulator
MDGVELLEAVKKIKPEIPIVMISGHGIWKQLSIRCGWGL